MINQIDTNPYYDMLSAEPKVCKEQIEFMSDNGFYATKRDESWVLWELKKWPEIKVWLQYFQSDLSQQYISMLIYKAGVDTGKIFQVNEMRLSLGMPALVDGDIQRLGSFRYPLLAIDHHPS
jgi:hypothetical protein